MNDKNQQLIGNSSHGQPALTIARADREVSLQDAARSFFDRPAPDGYLDEWTQRLARPETPTDHNVRSVVLFRLHSEWLALSTLWFVEVSDLQPIHAIPHRSNAVLLGLVNIRGQLRICVSMHNLLGVEPESTTPQREGKSSNGRERRNARPCMVILQDESDQWVFPAEEIIGVQRVPISRFHEVPSTFGKSSSQSQAVFDWQGHTVGLLDESRLLSTLRSLCA